MTQLTIAICVVLLFAFWGITFLGAWKSSPYSKYDERQVLARGRAFRDAFITMMVLCVFYLLLTEAFQIRFIGMGDALLSIILSGSGVFAVQSARSGALRGFRWPSETEGVPAELGGIFYPFLLTSVLMPVMQAWTGDFRLLNEEGLINTGPIISVILFLTGVAGMLAVRAYRKESREGEPKTDVTAKSERVDGGEKE